MTKFVKAIMIVAMVAAAAKAILAICGGMIFEVIAYAVLLGIFVTLYKKVVKEIDNTKAD